MRLSIYTCVKNGLFYDYHLVEMLHHHLSLADEIIVNDGQSTDGTYERIRDLYPKIKVFRSDWGKPTRSLDWITRFKNAARERCTGDWCICLDCDEFIPEWDFDRLRNHLAETSEVMIPMNVINFYGNYKVYHSDPDKAQWPRWKMNTHRNQADVEVWGEGTHVRFRGQEHRDRSRDAVFSLHHFGFVCSPARLRQKWHFLFSLYSGKPRWLRLPSFLFDWMPYDWMDPKFLDDLAVYDGPTSKPYSSRPRSLCGMNFDFTNTSNPANLLFRISEPGAGLKAPLVNIGVLNG